MGLALGSVVIAAAACGTSPEPGRTFPAPSVGPGRSVSDAVRLTRVELVRVLAAHQLVLTDTQTPVRPAEAPLLAGAPRAVYQVILPKDPLKGYIVVYEFLDPSGAAGAATEEAAYLATGPARVQTPPWTVTIIRQVGSTVVLYSWLPGAATDPSAAGIQAALESLGVGYPVPN
jgi:hypothetical protein